MKKDGIIYIIYKAYLDKNGDYTFIELVEADKNDKTIYSFTKLYNLQVPLDLKHKIQYQQTTAQVMDNIDEKSAGWNY